MRHFLILLLVLILPKVYAQGLFDLVKQGDIRAVKSYDGPVNLRDENQATPLMWAIFSEDQKMVKKLLKKGADPELKGWIVVEDSTTGLELIYGSCLALAAGTGNARLVRYFIEKKGISTEDREINLQTNLENGWTALHWAAFTGRVDIASYLIQRGASIDAVAPTNNNLTPLQFAVQAGHVEMAELLLNAGANCDQTDWLGISVLSHAFNQRSREMVKILLDNGASFDEREKKVLPDELDKAFGIGNPSEL
ncbi:MAG: ankyrin repeat domain-containing protein [Bacteroidales bacterium]|nr:ankyrin repeat domain-containing protein [Bacteroidales bacterium]